MNGEREAKSLQQQYGKGLVYVTEMYVTMYTCACFSKYCVITSGIVSSYFLAYFQSAYYVLRFFCKQVNNLFKI